MKQKETKEDTTKNTPEVKEKGGEHKASPIKSKSSKSSDKTTSERHSKSSRHKKDDRHRSSKSRRRSHSSKSRQGYY